MCSHPRNIVIIHDRLLRDRFATAEDFVRPEPATRCGYPGGSRTGLGGPAADRNAQLPGDHATGSPVQPRVGGGILAGGGRQHAGGAPGARTGRSGSTWAADSITPLPDTAKAFARSTISRWPSGALQRDGLHPARHGGGLRCAPRQRHGGHFRGRRLGVHAVHSPVQQLSHRKSRLPAWTFTWRTASATKSICTGWAMDIARR